MTGMFSHTKFHPWNFPGSPVVKTPPSNAEGTGSIPGRGAKIPHASKVKKKNNHHTTEEIFSSKFSRDFKNGPHQKLCK